MWGGNVWLAYAGFLFTIGKYSYLKTPIQIYEQIYELVYINFSYGHIFSNSFDAAVKRRKKIRDNEWVSAHENKHG